MGGQGGNGRGCVNDHRRSNNVIGHYFFTYVRYLLKLVHSDDVNHAHPQKRKDLSATEGHVMALEYMEETPLMLNRPGESQ